MRKILLAGVLVLALLAVAVKAEEEEISAPSAPETQQNEKYPAHDYVLQLNNDNLQDAIDEFPLILIKFYAPWCGHCKTLAPTYTEIAKTMNLAEEVVQVAEVDCTTSKDVCSKHGIRGYPTLKYFIDGEAHQYAGKRGHDDIVQWLQNKPSEARGQKEAEQL